MTIGGRMARGAWGRREGNGVVMKGMGPFWVFSGAGGWALSGRVGKSLPATGHNFWGCLCLLSVFGHTADELAGGKEAGNRTEGRPWMGV